MSIFSVRAEFMDGADRVATAIEEVGGVVISITFSEPQSFFIFVRVPSERAKKSILRSLKAQNLAQSKEEEDYW